MLPVMPLRYVRVASLKDIESGQAKQVKLEGLDLLVANWEGRYHVVQNACPHWGVELHWGWVRDRAIMCGWHGYRYDLETGEQQGWRDTNDLAVYPVRIKWKGVYVGLDDGLPPA